MVVGGRSEECCDKLEVYSNKTKLGQVSGLLLNPREFKSVDGRLDVYFRADYVRTYAGFHGYFLLDSTSDNFVLTASESSQNFTTPGFPLNYGKKTSWKCQIRAPIGKQVHFLVLYGQTEACCDKLEIKSNDVLIGTVSGQITTPKSFVSTNGILDIHFYSDSALEFEGIYATYKVATDDLLSSDKSNKSGHVETCIRFAEARYAAKTLSTPNYPDSYPPYAYCEWKIYAPEGKQVKLYLISGQTEPDVDYLKIWVNGSLFYEVSGNLTTQKTFTSLEGMLVIKFYANEAVELKGFHGYYQIDSELESSVLSAYSRSMTISSPGYPYECPFSSVSRYDLVAPVGQQVDFTLSSGQTDSCCVEVYSGDVLIANVSGSIDSPRTFSSTNGTLKVLFNSPEGVTSPGYVGVYNVQDRTYVDEVSPNETDKNPSSQTIKLYSSNSYNNLLSPSYPEEYSGHTYYTWNIHSASPSCEVKLVFIEIETEACCDLIEVFTDSSLVGVESGRYIKKKSYTSTGNSLAVKFFSDGTRQFKGFLAYYYNVCKFVFQHAYTVTETVQFFSTPGYPYSYASSESFTWTFSSIGNKQIYFSIISGGSEACCDFVEVFSGNQSLGKTSGKVQSPILFTSIKNTLTVKFTTDSRNQDTGFRFSYVTKPEVLARPEVKDFDGECGFEAQVSYQPQEFLMPECWSNTSRVTTCKWTLYAPPGYQITLDVEAEDSNDCCELLQIYSSNRLVSGTITDAANKKTYGSSDGTIVARYASNPTLGRRGYYKGTYYIKSPCDKVLPVNEKPTTFETPGYPDSYQNGLNCQWKLVAPIGRKIKFTLVSGESESCCDKLEIISDGCIKEEISGAIRTPKRFESDDNELIIRFKSDQNGVYSGFTGYYSLKPRSYFNFYDFSSSYPSYGSNIVVSSGNNIVVSSGNSGNSQSTNNKVTPVENNNNDVKDDDSSSDDGWSIDGWSVGGDSTSDDSSSSTQNSVSNVQNNNQNNVQNSVQNNVQNTQSSVSNTYINVGNSYGNTYGGGGFGMYSPGISFGYGFPSYGYGSSYYGGYYSPSYSFGNPYYGGSYGSSYYGGNSYGAGSSGGNNYGGNSIGNSFGSSNNDLSSSRNNPAAAPGEPAPEKAEATPVPTFFDNVSTKKRFGSEARATEYISEFTTPNYPENYPSDMYGEWVFTAEKGSRVNFTVLDGTSECCCDRMEISSGGKLLGVIAGDVGRPRIFISVGVEITVKFVSDQIFAKIGFKGTYTAISEDALNKTTVETDAKVCGFDAIAPSSKQIFQTPNYPQFYGDYLDCEYNLCTTSGNQVELVIEEGKLRDCDEMLVSFSLIYAH